MIADLPLCFSLGIMKLVVEDAPINLWVPQDSEIYQQKKASERAVLPLFSRVQQLIVTRQSSAGAQLLSPEVLFKVRPRHSFIAAACSF